MSASEADAAARCDPGRRARRRRGSRAPQRSRLKLKDNWWRHAVAMIAVVVALFPVVFIALVGVQPRQHAVRARSSSRTHVTLHNFGNLLHNNVSTSAARQGRRSVPQWIFNSMIVAGATAFF